MEHEYARHGPLTLLAGLDVQTGKVFASTSQTTRIVPFMNLVGQVMARPEYNYAHRVFVIVDNGSDHRGKAAIDRLCRAHPNAVSPNDFDSLDTAATSPTCSAASASTSRQPPHARPALQQPPDPQRTSGFTH